MNVDPAAWTLLVGAVALGFGIALATLAVAFVIVGLVLRTAGAIAFDVRRLAQQPTPGPPLVVTRTLLPADGFERPALPVAPLPRTTPRYVIPGRVDPSAPTEGMEHDEIGGPGDTIEAEAVVLEAPPAEGTRWFRMPRPSWATGDRH